MILADVREFIKRLAVNDIQHYYVGKLDSKPEKALGVYSLRLSGQPVTAIGCESTYGVIGVSLLIHYNNNATETEIAANKLYNKLRTVNDVMIKDKQIYMIELLVPYPVDVGTDDNGIYERVIEMKIYYERNDINDS